LLVGFVVHRVERSFLEVAFLSRADYWVREPHSPVFHSR
jgi:hypothetical protein